MKKILFCMIAVVLAVSLLCLPLFGAEGVSASSSSYILGDTDGDGDVTILDATNIQRILAHLQNDPDGEYTLRGDVDGDGSLSSIDVTLIMRYMAHLQTGYPIGEEIILPTEPIIEPTEEPTEAETVAPTQAPTVKPTSKPDPYELPPI